MKKQPQIPPDSYQMTPEEIEADFRRLHAEEAAGPSRRDFLRTATFAALGASALAAGAGRLLPNASAAPKGEAISTVARVEHAKAVVDGKPDAEIVDQMVNRAVCLLTGKKEPAAAWKAMFSPEDVVGIKINWIAGKGLSSNPEVIDAIVRALTALGVKENNVIVWDGSKGRVKRAGYKHNTGTTGLRAYDGPDAGYSEPYELKDSGVTTRITKILTEQVTALISVPVLKDHSGAGITFALKNIALGACNNPGAFHSNMTLSIPEFNAIDVVRKKHRLILGDALLACYNGGPGRRPQFVWTENAIMAARDPVAIDAVALKIIEAKRKEKGIAPIGKRAGHVEAAARMGLGTADPKRIEIVRDTLG